MPGPWFCLQIAHLKAKNYALYSTEHIYRDPRTVLITVTAPMLIHFDPLLPLATHLMQGYLWYQSGKWGACTKGSQTPPWELHGKSRCWYPSPLQRCDLCSLYRGRSKVFQYVSLVIGLTAWGTVNVAISSPQPTYDPHWNWWSRLWSSTIAYHNSPGFLRPWANAASSGLGGGFPWCRGGMLHVATCPILYVR